MTKNPYSCTYLSSILEHRRLTFGRMLGSYRDYSTPQRLTVTHSTAKKAITAPVAKGLYSRGHIIRTIVIIRNPKRNVGNYII